MRVVAGRASWGGGRTITKLLTGSGCTLLIGRVCRGSIGSIGNVQNTMQRIAKHNFQCQQLQCDLMQCKTCFASSCGTSYSIQLLHTARGQHWKYPKCNVMTKKSKHNLQYHELQCEVMQCKIVFCIFLWNFLPPPAAAHCWLAGSAVREALEMPKMQCNGQK